MSFKEHNVNSEQILLEYTKHDISELIAFGGIPLDPGMMDRLGFLEKDTEAFHVTNSEHLDEMSKNQNKKKQISCFTKGGPELARLPGQPNVLLLLEGTSVVTGETDIWTLVSTRDRRWLDINPDKHSKLNFLIKGVLQSVVNKIEYDIDIYKTNPKELTKLIEQLNNKQKVQLYRLYLTEMEAMLNRNYKELIKYLKNAADMQYNEVVLTKWQMIQGWCLGYEQLSTVQKFNDLGISYMGVMPRRDLSTLKI